MSKSGHHGVWCTPILAVSGFPPLAVGEPATTTMLIVILRQVHRTMLTQLK